jgi:hypothetical protein
MRASWFERAPDGPDGVVPIDAQLSRPACERRRRGSKVPLDVARTIGKPLGHERAVTSARDDQTGLFQLPVGARDRVRGEPEVGREVADRGQPLSGREPTPLDARHQAVAQLSRQRNASPSVQNDAHAPMMPRG